MTELIQHHIKYKEVDGIDEIVMVTKSEHNKIHKNHAPKRDKQTGQFVKGKHPDTLSKEQINRAHMRSPDRRKWVKEHRECIHFTNTPGKNTLLYETIEYYPYSGKVYITSRFQGNHGYKLPVKVIT